MRGDSAAPPRPEGRNTTFTLSNTLAGPPARCCPRNACDDNSGTLLYDEAMNCSHLVDRSAVVCLLALSLLGCDSNSKPLPPPTDMGSPGGFYDKAFAATVEFHDEVESNREESGSVSDLEFVDAEGNTVGLQQYREKQNVLLVFTRGFAGELCPFCTTQTSRLIANYEKFQQRDTEVLLVYPGAATQLPEFREASMVNSGKDSFPFPVLLDEDLAAVKQLGIAAQLAFPSTFILDKQGQVRLSYVGSDPTDRPSIKAILTQLDALEG